MTYKTNQTPSERYFSPTGDGTLEVLSLVVDEKTGKESVQVTGHTSLYNKIQEAARGSTLAELINTYQAQGVNNLEQIASLITLHQNAIEGDFTQVPTDLLSLDAFMRKSRQRFNELPVEIRAEFKHDPSEFFAAIQDQTCDKRVRKSIETMIKKRSHPNVQLQAKPEPKPEPKPESKPHKEY